jgi:hypothetical protein
VAGLAAQLRQSGDTVEATRYLLRLLGQDPFDEQAQPDLINTQLDAGHLSEMRRLYHIYDLCATDARDRRPPTAAVPSIGVGSKRAHGALLELSMMILAIDPVTEPTHVSADAAEWTYNFATQRAGHAVLRSDSFHTENAIA